MFDAGESGIPCDFHCCSDILSRGLSGAAATRGLVADLVQMSC